jgi:hypothetical protein
MEQMLGGFFSLLIVLAICAFWLLVLYVLWRILEALQRIDASIEDIAKTLRTQSLK